MDTKEPECVCGQRFSDTQTARCPACGREISATGKGPMGLSDSEIEAVHEVLAEEGAIWSGAR